MMRMARRASTAVPNVTNQAEKKTYRTRLGKRGNDQAKVSNDNENNNDNGITYLIFVIFRTPTPFRGLEIVRQKVRKFATKIALRQNSVKQYCGVKFTYLFQQVIRKRKGKMA